MAAFTKFFKELKNEHILGIIGILVLVLAIYKYSEDKETILSPMTPGPKNLGSANVGTPEKINTPNSNGSSYMPYNGSANASIANSASSAKNVNDMVMNKPTSNPSDLLPKDSNQSWSNLNPVSSDLKGVNLLNAQQMVGINTQGSSLRNANLQLRSEPANPRMNTNCPWNNSTIEEDKFRKPLEIGSSV